MPLAKILLATDGSSEAASAARMAITLSRSLGGELHVVYVGVAPSAYAAAESEILDYEFWKELREFAHKEASQSAEEEVRKIEVPAARSRWCTSRWAIRTRRSCASPRRSGRISLSSGAGVLVL